MPALLLEWAIVTLVGVAVQVGCAYYWGRGRGRGAGMSQLRPCHAFDTATFPLTKIAMME